MNARMRLFVAVGAGLMTFGSTGVASARPGVVRAAAPIISSITDELADLFQDGDSDAAPAQEADVIAASGEYKTDGIVLSVKVQKPTDPSSDSNWRSEGTLVSWYLETNGDRNEDFEAVYEVDSGKLTGKVFPINDSDDDPKPLCDLASATFDPAAGYTAVVPPKCIGDPKVVSYQVQVNYQSDPKDDTSLSYDMAPDSGFAGPLSIGGTVSPLGTPSTPTSGNAGQGGSGGSSTAPVASSSPTTASSAPGTTAPGSVKAPAGSSRAPSTASKAPSPTNGTGPVSGGVTAVPGLAHTGLGDRTLRIAAFALGIALIGVGLLFGNRRPSLR